MSKRRTWRSRIGVRWLALAILSAPIGGCRGSQQSLAPGPDLRGDESAVVEDASRREPKRALERTLAALSGASSLTLYAIAPSLGDGDEDVFGKGLLHDHPILAGVEVRDAEARDAVVAALRQHLWDPRPPRSNRIARCFIPRHAVRIRHGEATTDILICFQCSNAYVYVPERKTMVGADPEPRALLDDLLAKTGFVRPPNDEWPHSVDVKFAPMTHASIGTKIDEDLFIRRALAQPLRRCYIRGPRDRPRRAGRIILEVTPGADSRDDLSGGYIWNKVRIVSNTLRRPALGECVSHAVEQSPLHSPFLSERPSGRFRLSITFTPRAAP